MTPEEPDVVEDYPITFPNRRGSRATWWAELIVIIMRVFVIVGITGVTLRAIYGAVKWPEIGLLPANSPKSTSFMAAFILVIAVLALLILLDAILSRLLKILMSVSSGDPFIMENARRLQHIGWIMVAMQALSYSMEIAIPKVSDRNFDSDFTPFSILTILLVFVLSHVFEQGAAMREENDGTV